MPSTIVPVPGMSFFPLPLGFFPLFPGKIFFFPPYDSYHRPSTEARGREDGAERGPSYFRLPQLRRIRHPPPPPPIARSRRPTCSRSITTPSTFPPLGAASLRLPQPPQHPILPHHRQRHAIIPKSHCQGGRSHEGGQTSETYCALRPGTSSDEAIVL